MSNIQKMLLVGPHLPWLTRQLDEQRDRETHEANMRAVYGENWREFLEEERRENLARQFRAAQEQSIYYDNLFAECGRKLDEAFRKVTKDIEATMTAERKREQQKKQFRDFVHRKMGGRYP